VYMCNKNLQGVVLLAVFSPLFTCQHHRVLSLV
jgi:hypothetical protein